MLNGFRHGFMVFYGYNEHYLGVLGLSPVSDTTCTTKSSSAFNPFAAAHARSERNNLIIYDTCQRQDLVDGRGTG